MKSVNNLIILYSQLSTFLTILSNFFTPFLPKYNIDSINIPSGRIFYSCLIKAKDVLI